MYALCPWIPPNVAVSLVVSIKRRNPLQLRTRADIVLRYLLLDAKDL